MHKLYTLVAASVCTRLKAYRTIAPCYSAASSLQPPTMRLGVLWYRRHRRWCCRFCVLSERAGAAARIGSNEIDRHRCRRRAHGLSSAPTVWPRFRPVITGAVRRTTVHFPVIIPVVFGVVITHLYSLCGSILPLCAVASILLLFNNINVCISLHIYIHLWTIVNQNLLRSVGEFLIQR